LSCPRRKWSTPVRSGTSRDWHFKLDMLNALDERYYRARTGDALGDALAQAMPARHWQFTSSAHSEMRWT
jgi:hypothetical protein